MRPERPSEREALRPERPSEREALRPERPSERESRSHSRVEGRSWLFMRLSGLALVVLSLVHFAITHIVNDVMETDFAFVAGRWRNPGWRVFDWLLLALALAHGLNGLRGIVGDYVRSVRSRRVIMTGLIALSGSLFLLGTATIVGF